MMKHHKKRLLKIGIIAAMLGILFVMSSKPTYAQDETAVDALIIQIDTIWLFLGSVLVFWMQAGFAMVESGFSRAKNAANLLMKNLIDFAGGALLFFAVGFGLMYGASAGGIIGTSNFFLTELDPAALDAYSWVDFLFQLMFAAAAATIVSGAVAERLKFKAYLIYSMVITGLIYPISGHWHWGGGWLAELGFIDFAGSTIVHAVGGFAALAAAKVLGPRIGKFNKDGSSNSIPGHSLTLAALGVFILWMGWFGFNAGSTLSGMNPGIAFVAVTTTLAASAGTVSALLVNWHKAGHPSTEMALNGALAGLVAITAGTANVTPIGAIVIGLIAGPVLVYGINFVERVLKVDDPVGAVAVHGFNGLWGTVAVGLFAYPAAGTLTNMGAVAGLFYGGGVAQLGIQLLGTAVISAWAFGTMGALFYLMKITIGIRVSAEEEMEGLDISEHFTTSYPEFGPAAKEAIALAGD
ncbi:ammonium transporter [Candidatus Leptofilum sp.]|uniref:ammonium transporter n=1 Tax=Candidatus Leptofilum sp. TaxID=3241576 RepID=UPI003B5B1AA9